MIEDSDNEVIADSDDEVERTGLSVILRKNKLEHWNEEEDETDFLDGIESMQFLHPGVKAAMC